MASWSDYSSIIYDSSFLIAGFLFEDIQGGVKIVKYEGELTHLTIPSSLLNRDVLEIGAYAFKNSKLINVVVPDTVIEIKAGAFASVSTLKNVTLSKSLKNIGEEAFYYTGIEEIELPDTLEDIGKLAFAGSKLKSIELPNKLTRISSGLFYNCEDLSEVMFPNNLISIEAQSFFKTNLTQIDLPDSLQNISYGAFSGTKLTSVTIPKNVNYIYFPFSNTNLVEINVDPESATYQSKDGVLFTKDGETLVLFPEKHSQNGIYTIPDGTVTIGIFAFEKTTVKEVIVPEGVTWIEQSAFSHSSTEKLTLPSTVNISQYALVSNSLKEIIIDQSNNNFKVIDNALIDSHGNMYNYLNGNQNDEFIIPSEVISINQKAFLGSKIKKIITQSGLKTILAIMPYTLESIYLSDTVEYIDSNGLVYSLEEIIVDDANEYYFVEDNSLFYQDGEAKILVFANPSSTNIFDIDNQPYNYYKIPEFIDGIDTSTIEVEILIITNPIIDWKLSSNLYYVKYLIIEAQLPEVLTEEDLEKLNSLYYIIAGLNETATIQVPEESLEKYKSLFLEFSDRVSSYNQIGQDVLALTK